MNFTSLPLTPEESKTYANILEAVSALPKSDPRYSFVIGVTWWLFNRRRRLEQQSIRRRQFYRRWRRLLLLQWQKERNSIVKMPPLLKSSDLLSSEEFEFPNEKRLVKNERKDLWLQIEEGDFAPDNFMQQFHISSSTFEFIYNEISEELNKSNATMKDVLPAKKRLAATIYRLATNAEYLKVANFFGISKSTTTSLVRDVCEIIVNQLKDKYLTFFPTSDSTLKENIENASKAFQIPQCVGVLGSIDVFIVGSTFSKNENLEYSSSYSKNLAVVFQSIVDYTGCFAFVTAGNPSSLSNAEIAEESNIDNIVINKFGELEKTIEGVKVPIIVATDRSHYYSNSKHLLTPTNSNDGEDEEIIKLNERITAANKCFSEALLKVKSRWRIFHGKNGKINFNVEAFQNIAMACCILHNICELRGDAVNPEWNIKSEDGGDALFVRKYDDDQVSSQSRDDDLKMDCLDANDMTCIPAVTDVQTAIASYVHQNS